MLKKAWDWLVYSSVNADKISLTVKAVLTGLATWVTVLLGLSHVGYVIPSDTIALLINGIVAFIQEALLIVSTIATIIGLVRKIWKTANGTNEVVNQGV